MISPELDDAFLALLVPGATIRIHHGPTSELRHIRAIIDENWIVYRVWRIARWQYHIEWAYKFQSEWRGGIP